MLRIVVGGQFGSEGKGRVCAALTKIEEYALCIRTGGPNAGHSYQDGSMRYIFRQLPISTNEKTRLLIPAGAVIDPLVMSDELAQTKHSVGIDGLATILHPDDSSAERGMFDRISSTQTGTGYAHARRVMRTTTTMLAKDYKPFRKYLTCVADEAFTALRNKKNVLIEGTQGFGLSNYHSPFYPCATSKDTTAAGVLSEVGLGPMFVEDVIVVFRTFPIRVAGKQAGPLLEEIDWETVTKESGYPHPVEERTTVTGRVRRVGRWNMALAAAAVKANYPCRLAINFLDYLSYYNMEATTERALMPKTRDFLKSVVCMTDSDILMVGCGPDLKQTIFMGMVK